MYRLIWSPDVTRDLNCTAFAIILTPIWQEAVKRSPLTQKNIDALIDNFGPTALRGHGYQREIYEARSDIRIEYGPDGIEFMQVPGNGCWLSLDRKPIFYGRDMWALESHNVDNFRQASLLLTMFLKVADAVEHFETSQP